jgi:cyclopropane fatty-acyl-phospholipid synthase-like methyltransferase
VRVAPVRSRIEHHWARERDLELLLEREYVERICLESREPRRSARLALHIANDKLRFMNASVNSNKALWEKGDFTRIAATMRESGEALVQKLGITKGLKVLDLGCGDGTTAVPAAKLGADVLGIDIAKNLVEAGNRRAAEHGLSNLKFQEGDASNLEHLPDKSFDLVVSIFGACLRRSRSRLPRRWSA